MNSNTSAESPITSMEQPFTPLNLMQESPPPPSVSQLEPMTRPPTLSPIMSIGENESNQILIPSAAPSPLKNETNSASPSSNLRSNAKPHVLLDEPPKIRVLKVSKDDIKALCQVITEFQEQFVGF